MAFTQNNLAKMAQQTIGGFDKYTYTAPSGDDLAIVAAPSYFARSRFKSEPDWVGSVIEVRWLNNYAIITVAANDESIVLIDNLVLIDSLDLIDNLDLPANRVYVKSAADLANPVSTVEYFIDGEIDMGTQSIEVPVGGLHLRGYDFDISGLYSTADNYTMFTSPIGGSGDILGADYYISTSGASSKVYDIVSATGAGAFEFTRVNYNNCTSLGTIDNYRQGLEIGTGRFGGSPSLTLKGAWAGGYRITTSIVRALSAGMTEPLFKAGAAFVMQSRFLTDINCDLPSSAALLDFTDANLPNSATLLISGATITRGGVSDPTDANLTPNISASNLSCFWDSNRGIDNTFPGGELDITVETPTPVPVIGTWYQALGTWATENLQHFDSPVAGRLRFLGNNPRAYRVEGSLIVDGTANNDIAMRIRKFDFSTSTTSTVGSQPRQVNNFSGARDVAFFNFIFTTTLDANDYLFMELQNNTSTAALTVELDSFILVSAR